MEEKRGQLAEIIYQNEENGYLVGVFQTNENEMSIVGYMHSAVKKGGIYKLTGEWKTHASYGEQFYFNAYVEEMPESEEAIEYYLGSGVLKGIGPKTAACIVQRFGKDTFKVIEENPERLTDVEGIGPVKAASIAEAFNDHRELMNITMFLQKYGIQGAYALKLYKIYKNSTIEVIKENPYKLVEDVYGIGFKTADTIAEKMDIATDSPLRVASGIKYMLNHFAGEGHTFVPAEYFSEKTAEILDISKVQVHEIMTELALEGAVHLENLENRTVIFSMPYFYAETNVCKNLIKLLKAELKPIQADISELIHITESELDIQLADNQKLAVQEAMTNGIYVITGGPGTGKTTTINSLIHIFNRYGMKTVLAAPTGRAAKRITETSGFEAKTIHRLLEYNFSENEAAMRFNKNEENTIEGDVIIVDEMSMVDILLMNGLLKAITPGTRLILVGDADQLPSVGAGNVLRDIINSEVIPFVKLNEIFRQARESLIVVNAHKINKGEYPDYNEKDKDFFFLRQSNELQILETIKTLFHERLPKYYKECNPVRDIQILTPGRKGLLGTHHLNKELQQLLNPAQSHISEKLIKDKLFREGDKVMQIKNNYNAQWRKKDDFSEGQGIFNGDVGFIQKIDNEDGEMTVLFDDNKIVIYDFSQIEELELAYAVTVHKSQGSEFPIIIMPMGWFPPILMTRNLLYTAVTRARSAVVLVGGEKYVHGMIQNNRIIERYSGLGIRLNKFIEEQVIEW